MKISMNAVAAMLMLTGCMNDSDEDPASGGDGKDDGMPRLYSELDSIVFNQLDFLYYTNKWKGPRAPDPQEVFSPAAMELLTDDTLLFQRDTGYWYGNSTPVAETFVRTKFNPKGWFAFHDTEISMTCTDTDTEPTGNWMIKVELGPGLHRACYRNADNSPSTQQLFFGHYRDKGFMVSANTPLLDRDFGKARLYYWR